MKKIFALLLLLLCLSCVTHKPIPPLVPAPVVHVPAGPEVPQYDFQAGPNMTVCLDLAGFVAQQQELAYLYARLEYFKALLLGFGCVFDPPVKEEPEP